MNWSYFEQFALTYISNIIILSYDPYMTVMRGHLYMRTVSYSLYMRYIKRSYTDSYEYNIPVISVIYMSDCIMSDWTYMRLRSTRVFESEHLCEPHIFELSGDFCIFDFLRILVEKNVWPFLVEKMRSPILILLRKCFTYFSKINICMCTWHHWFTKRGMYRELYQININVTFKIL